MSLTREDKLAIAAEADRAVGYTGSHDSDGNIADVDRALCGGNNAPWHDEVRRLAALRAAPPADLLSPEERATGIGLIAAERRRHVTAEGWTPEHDDEHAHGEMAIAAACYALPRCRERTDLQASAWPWAREWWKPTPDDRVRELVKAGALIAAEIDRLLRAEGA